MMREKKENFGISEARKFLANLADFSAEPPLDEEKKRGQAVAIVQSLLFFFFDGQTTTEKWRYAFLRVINDSGINPVELEQKVNLAANFIRHEFSWRVLLRAGKISLFDPEYRRSGALWRIAVEKKPASEEQFHLNRRKKAPLPSNGKPAANQRRYRLDAFLTELRKNSRWFSSLPCAAQNEKIRQLDAKLGDMDVRLPLSDFGKILSILPLLWRGGLNPDKGLADAEFVLFVLNTIFDKEADEELVELADRHLINQLVSEIVLKDKLGDNSLWLTRLEMQERLDKIFLPELGLIVVAYQRGKFKGTLQSTVEKLIERVETVLPEALVRRLFLEEEKKTE